MKQHLFGITLDRIGDLDATVDAVASLPRRPTVRVVMDPNTSPSDYAPLLSRLCVHADIMACPVDSSWAVRLSPPDYSDRFRRFIDRLNSYVKYWEVGNEINGDWTGDPKESVQKTLLAKRVVATMGGMTACTFHGGTKPETDFASFVDSYMPSTERNFHFAFISYYEEDNGGLSYDWDKAIDSLGSRFPNSLLGVGECGAKDSVMKESLMRNYYRMDLHHPRFVGGYFWWYFSTDCVPKTLPLWGMIAGLAQ